MLAVDVVWFASSKVAERWPGEGVGLKSNLTTYSVLFTSRTCVYGVIKDALTDDGNMRTKE